MAKDKLSKEKSEKGYATLFYSLGKGMAGGVDRAPGTFASIGGLFSYGTHRDGRYGIIDPVSGRFIPAGGRHGDDDKDDGEDGDNENGNNQKTLIKPFKPFQPKLPANAGWDRTIQKYLKPPGGGNNDNPTQSRGLFTGRAKIGNMKEGGLVRGAGKAERGRGRGKMV